MKTIISVSLTKELVEKIDQVKNLATRSVYIEFLLKKALGEENGK